MRLFYVLGLTWFLASCNSSGEAENSEAICNVKDSLISCDGGYSYWIGDLFATSQETIAVTGVKRERGQSRQWVAFVDSKLSQVLAEHSFPRKFKSDEHNAPAVIKLSNGWLVARTGHNDEFSDGQGLIQLAYFDEAFNLTFEQELFLANGATYVQLLDIASDIYLLTRDKELGWGIFVKSEGNQDWSPWSRLKLSSGRNYVLMDKAPIDASENILLTLAKHPLDLDQKIIHTLIFAAELQARGELLDLNKASKPITEFSIKNVNATNIRLLDVKVRDQSTCHLRSMRVGSNWRLTLQVIESSEPNIQPRHLELGTFSGMLGDNVYITGASIKQCASADGELVKVLVTHKRDDNRYQLTELVLDTQTSEIIDEVSLYQSTKQLYRPVYIPAFDKVMVNEAEYWNTYENWRANQIIF
ncbi:hypothetical protein [Thalassotalea euphylliae]|uniref:Uncharacterized protein n=1 Tax=Thalassotalea euphylliae TaxID=1655234 RepID=A0A3E0UDC0_9GAMM|nr:hypothetical protein [Thalassotalea euphylliae]REL34896.1 hypothetical protein DXX92_05695 [Thalassotalea euphylliae]